jgi:hypothetical protein
MTESAVELAKKYRQALYSLLDNCFLTERKADKKEKHTVYLKNQIRIDSLLDEYTNKLIEIQTNTKYPGLIETNTTK